MVMVICIAAHVRRLRHRRRQQTAASRLQQDSLTLDLGQFDCYTISRWLQRLHKTLAFILILPELDEVNDESKTI